MWIWEWRCHGHTWQVIPSRRFPERNDYTPKCPTCGHAPTRKWVRV